MEASDDAAMIIDSHISMLDDPLMTIHMEENRMVVLASVLWHHQHQALVITQQYVTMDTEALLFSVRQADFIVHHKI